MIMKVSKIYTLDKQDIIILLKLKENARISYSALAESTHMSDVAVKKRIDALISNQIIEKFTIITNEFLDMDKKEVRIPFKDIINDDESDPILG